MDGDDGVDGGRDGVDVHLHLLLGHADGVVALGLQELVPVAATDTSVVIIRRVVGLWYYDEGSRMNNITFAISPDVDDHHMHITSAISPDVGDHQVHIALIRERACHVVKPAHEGVVPAAHGGPQRVRVRQTSHGLREQ